MRIQAKVGMVATALAITTTFAVTSVNADDEAKSVSAAIAQFYTALNDLFEGETAAMEQVWSHADDVLYMGPMGGMQVGWEQVLNNWKSQAAKRLGGEVKPEKLQIVVGPQMAVACCFEVGTNVVNGQPQQVSIRATNTFRKEGGKWKMIGHHTDLLPFLPSPADGK